MRTVRPSAGTNSSSDRVRVLKRRIGDDLSAGAARVTVCERPACVSSTSTPPAVGPKREVDGRRVPAPRWRSGPPPPGPRPRPPARRPPLRRPVPHTGSRLRAPAPRNAAIGGDSQAERQTCGRFYQSRSGPGCGATCRVPGRGRADAGQLRVARQMSAHQHLAQPAASTCLRADPVETPRLRAVVRDRARGSSNFDRSSARSHLTNARRRRCRTDRVRRRADASRP